jgi:hypothetical protein
MWATIGKFVGAKVLTALLVVSAGASLIWFWKHPEVLQALWAGLKGVLAWLGFVIVLPWSLFFVTVKVVKMESNQAAVALVLGFLAVDIIVALWLADWSITGALTWVVVLLGFLTAGVYNFLVCDYVADQLDGRA